MLRKLVCLLSAMLLLFCSSAPQEQFEAKEKKNRAAASAESGNKYFIQGDYDKALEFFFLALAYNGAIYGQAGIALSYNSIGKVYLAQGLLKNAEYYFNLAYEIAKEIEDYFLIAQSQNNIGEIKLSITEYDVALKYFNLCLENLEKAKQQLFGLENDKRVLYTSLIENTEAIVNHNIGVIYKYKKDYKTALGFLNKALEINLNRKNYAEAASNYYMIGSIFSEMENYAEAVANINLALEYDQKVENSLGIAKDFFALGRIYDKQGNLANAYKFYYRSLFVYRSMRVLYPTLDLKDVIIQILDYLITVTEKLGKKVENANFKRLQQEEINSR